MAYYLASFTIFPYDRDLCRWWAAASVEARRSGRPIQCADAWIAATALLYGVPLVSHNPNDYSGVTGLTVLTEAQPSPMDGKPVRYPILERNPTKIGDSTRRLQQM